MVDLLELLEDSCAGSGGGAVTHFEDETVAARFGVLHRHVMLGGGAHCAMSRRVERTLCSAAPQELACIHVSQEPSCCCGYMSSSQHHLHVHACCCVVVMSMHAVAWLVGLQATRAY
jgi:hypothetical protein